MMGVVKQCPTCGGKGKVRLKTGRKVTCPACKGVGKGYGTK